MSRAHRKEGREQLWSIYLPEPSEEIKKIMEETLKKNKHKK